MNLRLKKQQQKQKKWKKENRHRSFTALTKREIRHFLCRSRAVAAKKCSRNPTLGKLEPNIRSLRNDDRMNLRLKKQQQQKKKMKKRKSSSLVYGPHKTWN